MKRFHTLALASVGALCVTSGGLGCLAPADLSPLGFACSQDSDCGEGGAFSCVQSVCTPSREPLSLPLRGVFFSGGYPFGWNSVPADRPSPLVGRYDSTDPAVLSGQLSALHHANVALAMVTWWGPDTVSDQTFDALLQQSRSDGLRWAVVNEREPQDHPSATQIRLLLSDLYTRYAQAPNYGWIGEQYVVVVPTVYNATCEVADRWVAGRDASRTPAYLLIQVPSNMAEGAERDCASQPDAWYRLPVDVSSTQTAQATVITPGIWKPEDATPSLPRDLARFQTDVATQSSAAQPLRLINSFNDWVNGTYVEASAADPNPTAYLDVLHDTP